MTLPYPTDPNWRVANTPAHAAAIHRLRWFLIHDFRPAEHRVKDYDIIQNNLRELKSRSEASSRTLFVQIHGHSGNPVHGKVDRLAV